MEQLFLFTSTSFSAFQFGEKKDILKPRLINFLVARIKEEGFGQKAKKQFYSHSTGYSTRIKQKPEIPFQCSNWKTDSRNTAYIKARVKQYAYFLPKHWLTE